MVISDYDIKIILGNGTELDLNNINQDAYVDVYVPLTNLEMANFNYTELFSSQGYNIYDQNNDFYQDICTSANIDGNDIPLKDRKKDIYPSNITICKKNCEFSGINIEDQKVICSCNLNSKKNSSLDEDKNENFMDEETNFVSYILNQINYQIFKCYKLIIIADNIKKNFSIYLIMIVSLVILVLDCLYYFLNRKKLKKFKR